jgi:hypothetical protein
METTYKELLYKFSCKEGSRLEFFCKTFNINANGKDWHCSTDFHCAFLVPKMEGVVAGEISEKNRQTLIKVFESKPGETATFTIQELQEAHKALPREEIDDGDECESCEGEGAFDHHGYDYMCKACNGGGEIKNGRTKVIVPKEVLVKICGRQMAPVLLEQLIHICTKLGLDTIEGVATEGTHAAYFRIGEAIFLRMGIMEQPNSIVVEVSPGSKQNSND